MTKQTKFLDSEGNPVVKGRLYSHPLDTVCVVRQVNNSRITIENYSLKSLYGAPSTWKGSDARQTNYLTPMAKADIQRLVGALKSNVRNLEATVKNA